MRIKYIIVALVAVVLCACKVTAWEDKTSNTYWEASEGDWDGSKWTSADYGTGHWIVLRVSSDWVSAYKPNKMKITFTNSESGVVNYDLGCEGAGTVYVDVSGVASGVISDLDPSSTCPYFTLLRVFSLDTEQEFEVTKIEFGFYTGTLSIGGSSSLISSGGNGSIIKP